MANQYSVIIRATNDLGNKFDLEVLDIPDFLLDISAIELGEIGTVFGISSQEVTLPGNDNSNKFFNNVFDIGATPAVALNKSVPCQVLVDGEAVFTGKLRINNVVSDDWNNIVYNCVVANETVDFRILNENKAIADLNWSKYAHPYTYASISSSWAETLFTGSISGSILYPLINYGANPSNVNASGFEFGGGKYQMDNPSTPIQVSQFKPAVQAKTIIDEVFSAINYKYTSSFINSNLFKELFLVATPDDKDGISFVSSNSGSKAFATVTQSIASGFTTITPTLLNFQTVVYNNGNNFNVVADSYTADYTGNYILNFNIPYNITSNFGPLLKNNPGRKFILYVAKTTLANVIHTSVTPLPSSTSGTINSGNISINLTSGDVIYFYFALQTPPTNGIEQLTTVVTSGANGVYVTVQTPQNPIGQTVDISKIFGDLKILDFIKGLVEKFNLVIEPVENQKNFLRIEPYNDWLNLGTTINWTEILDRSIKYKVEHPVNSLPKKFIFSDDYDEDVLNAYQFNNTSKIYGSYSYQTDSDLASGENQIGGFFAATPVKGLPTKGNNGTVVVPWLVKQEPGKYAQPFKFKPRLLFRQPIKNIPNNEMFGTVTGSFTAPTGSTFYYIDDPQNNGVRALSYYRTVLATNESPTVFSSSLDLHYTNIGYYPFQQPAVNGQCQDGVYNRYWAYYINSLYDIDARLLTCNIILDPSDIKDIKLNDKIFIDGHLYRINRISGANLVQRQSTEVELIRLPTRTQPFTGRRRIPTGMNPTDYVDVITNDFTNGGSVSYVNYETNDPITDSQVLSYAAGLDGYEAYDTEVTWNTQDVTTVNPNSIILGNTKYNETQNYVISVGAGNTLSDNASNITIFGTDNTVSDAANNVTVIANSASILESNNTILLQATGNASGSRIVTGSENNVIINPIRNITPYYNSTNPNVVLGDVKTQGTKAVDYYQNTFATGSNLYLSGSDGQYSFYDLTYSGSTGFATVNLPSVTNIDGLRYQFLANNVSSTKFFRVLPSGSQLIDSGSSKSLTITGSLYEIQVISGSWKTIIEPGVSAGGGGGGAISASYISVFDTTDQTIDGALTASVFEFNNVDFYNGITLVSSSRFTVAEQGVYNLEFSAQLDKTTGTKHDAYIWLRENGTDVPNSNTIVTMGGGSSDLAVAAWNFYVSASAGDYYEIAWTADSTQVFLNSVAAAPGVYPAVPSIIATMGKIGGGTTITNISGSGVGFPFTGSAVITGSLSLTGSFEFTGLISNPNNLISPVTTKTAFNSLLIGPIYNSSSITVVSGSVLKII